MEYDNGYPSAYPVWYKNLIDRELKFITQWQIRTAFPSIHKLCSYEVNFNNWDKKEIDFFEDNICDNSKINLNENTEITNDIQALNLIDSNGIVLSPNSLYDNSMQFITRCAEPVMFTLYILPLSMIVWRSYHKYKYRHSPIHESSKKLCYGIYCFVKLAFGHCIQDFLTQAVKVLVRGDRPYWIYPRFLRQFSMTCETGGGFPSGHLGSASYIVHSSLGFLILFMIDLNPNESRLMQRMHQWKLSIIVFAVLLSEVVLALVAISRVYTSSHFIHQTVVGWFIGLLVASLVHLLLTYRRFQLFARQSKKRNIIFSIFAISGSFATSLLLLRAAVTNWSSRGASYTLMRAMTGCRSKEAKFLSSKYFAVLISSSVFVICYNIIPILFIHKNFYDDRLLQLEEARIRTGSDFVPLNLSSKYPKDEKRWHSIIRTILYCIAWVSSIEILYLFLNMELSPEIQFVIRALYTGLVPWYIILSMP